MTVHESIYAVPKMDCPSEERLIRMALDDVRAVRGLTFDLAARRVLIRHEGADEEIARRLEGVGLGATFVQKGEPRDEPEEIPDPIREARTLRLVLAINAAMFVGELVMSWFARSAGLLADSLDMFADAAVYGLALYAVGRGAARRTRIAHVAGWLQAALAVGALVEVVRRFLGTSDPEPPLMMIVAGVALVANVTCLWLVSRHREGGAHMKASIIFSANDVIANVGVIAAGALVAWTGSRYPDLAIGAIIAAIVLLGARKILRLA